MKHTRFLHLGFVQILIMVIGLFMDQTHVLTQDLAVLVAILGHVCHL